MCGDRQATGGTANSSLAPGPQLACFPLTSMPIWLVLRLFFAQEELAQLGFLTFSQGLSGEGRFVRVYLW